MVLPVRVKTPRHDPIGRNHFESTDERVVEELELAFRDYDVLAGQLLPASFEVTAVWGD